MSEFPFRIVGFDLDGTLLDTAGDLGAAVNHALAGAGREPVPASAYTSLVGGGARLMLSRAFELTGGAVAEAAFEAHFAALLAHYEANIAVSTRPYPGVEAMLDALAARGARLAVATNKAERFARRVLDALGLADRFTCILGGDTLGPGRGKPAPDMLLALVESCGGGRAAFVGDSSFDVRAARAAGLPCVAVRFGYSDMAVEDLGADATIGHFDELIRALERL